LRPGTASAPVPTVTSSIPSSVTDLDISTARCIAASCSAFDGPHPTATPAMISTTATFAIIWVS
jgi:hypothetical protein